MKTVRIHDMKEELEQRNRMMVHITPFGPIKFYPEMQIVFSPLVEKGEKPIFLDRQKTQLLEILMENPMAVYSKYQFFPEDSVDLNLLPTNREIVAIARLREKLGDTENKNKGRKKFRLIHSIRSKGFTLTSNAEIVSSWRGKAEKIQDPELLPNMFRHKTPHGNLILFADRHIAISPLIDTGYVELDPDESKIVRVLMEKPGGCNYDDFLKAVGDTIKINGIRVRMTYIRAKLGDVVIKNKSRITRHSRGTEYRLIHTIRGIGYSLENSTASNFPNAATLFDG